METGKTIALTGIIATAVVGVAGAGASWPIAREDRINQRALAHDARVYDRRANVYVEAEGFLGSLEKALVYGGKGQMIALLDHQFSKENDRLLPRLVAYGSDDANKAYREAMDVVTAIGNERLQFAIGHLTTDARTRRGSTLT